MEDMDIDQVVEVPDTPDRLAARHIIGRERVGKVSSSPLDLSNRDLVDEKYVNGMRVRGRFINDNGRTRRLVIHPPRNPSNLDIKSRRNSNFISSGDNSSASQNADFLRGSTVDKTSSLEAKHSTGTESMDKGKALGITISSTPSAFQENAKAFDLTKQNSDSRLPKKVFPHGGLEDLVAEDTRKGKLMSVGSSFVDCTPSHLERSKNALKGKEKIEDNTSKGLGLAVALGKGVDLSTDPQQKMGWQKPMPPHSFTLSRVSGQKRLVRNGCISPHNIATRTKQLSEQHNNSFKNIEQSHAGNPSSNGSPNVIDISDIVTEDDKGERVKGKGKGVIIHSSTPRENNSRNIYTSGRDVKGDIEANGTSEIDRDISGCSEGLGGWRSTRNRSRTIEYSMPDSTEHLPWRINGNLVNQYQNRVERRNSGSRRNQRTEDDFAKDLYATETASRLVSELDQRAGPCHAAETVIKKQKKRGLSLGNRAECSSSVSGNSDIVFLGSSEASGNSRSSRIHRPQFQGSLNPVIEVDELSPAGGHTVPQRVDCMNDDSDARARQLEADERLARELQEQLYHEVPTTGGGEIDEHLAWALQQEENALNTSSRGNHNLSHRRGSMILHSNRQPRPEAFQNPSNRRGAQARVPNSRMAQLRTRFRNQSPRVSTRGRNLRFPLDMDLDMRMNILEALEAAVDVNDVRLDNGMLQLQREFNDNDYEMLLALDENNHQHAGATVHQINNLPQSTVQTDASEEVCAICLETPTIGETVRHLPCLHRFHKECIDPWLGRRTLCPVCKCSIT